MRTIQAAIVGFSKPFFTYNANGYKVLPTDVSPNSEAIATLEEQDKYFEANTIEEVMSEFNRLGFVMPEEDVWDFPERHIRMFMTDAQYLELLTVPEYRGFLNYFDLLKDFVVIRNGGRYIYLEELYEEHRVIFEQFGAIVQTN